jgi:hypothetical protein
MPATKVEAHGAFRGDVGAPDARWHYLGMGRGRAEEGNRDLFAGVLGTRRGRGGDDDAPPPSLRQVAAMVLALRALGVFDGGEMAMLRRTTLVYLLQQAGACFSHDWQWRGSDLHSDSLWEELPFISGAEKHWDRVLGPGGSLPPETEAAVAAVESMVRACPPSSAWSGEIPRKDRWMTLLSATHFMSQPGGDRELLARVRTGFSQRVLAAADRALRDSLPSS